jgi:hypothetical protein
VSASEGTRPATAVAVLRLGAFTASLESRHVLGVQPTPDASVAADTADLAAFFGAGGAPAEGRRLLRLRVPQGARLLWIGEAMQLMPPEVVTVHRLPRLLEGLPHRAGIVALAHVNYELTYLLDPELLFASMEARSA